MIMNITVVRHALYSLNPDAKIFVLSVTLFLQKIFCSVRPKVATYELYVAHVTG